MQVLTHRHSCAHTFAVRAALHAHVCVLVRMLAPAQEQSRHADTDPRDTKASGPTSFHHHRAIASSSAGILTRCLDGDFAQGRVGGPGEL